MLNKYEKITADHCFKEFSFDINIDVQELMFISNVLITDYSSCFVDFLMLNRPVLFYHYDDYENNDNEVYLNSKDLSKVGLVSHNEDELFNHIVSCYNNDVGYSNMNSLFYNEYNDDNSCKRCISQIQSILSK